MEPAHDADPVGGGGGAPWRAPATPRAPAREAAGVAVASGKGGAGKTFLTANLAIALHRRGQRVVVVDCDFGLANAHLLLGVTPHHTLTHVLAGGLAVAEALEPTPFGPALVPGGSGVVSLTELGPHHMEALARALGQLAGSFDVVLIDCGAGLMPQTLAPVLAAQHVLVVANPEIASMTDAYALVKCVARQGAAGMLHLAVNRAPTDGHGLGYATFERLADVSRRFARREIHYLGEVPEDPAAAHRRHGQPPLVVGHAACAAAIAVNRIGERLQPHLERCRNLPQPGIEARMREQALRW
ncbi:MAG: AAA family ATPase [Planctomycetota bacterium]